MNNSSIETNIISRRNFLRFGGGLSIALAITGLSTQITNANQDTSTFKKGIKCGFLPITDHLLIILGALFSHPQYRFIPIKFSQWADLAEALRAGAIDMAFTLAPIGMELAAQNVPINLLLNSHTNGSSLNIRIDSNITNTKELQNKKIAVPSRFSSQYFLLDRILNSNGLDLGQIQTIDMSPPEMQAALYSHVIDAFIVAEPFGVIANKRKIAKTLLYSKDVYPNHTCCNIVARQNILEDSIIKELASSLQQARMILLKDLPQAIRLQSQIMGQNPQAIQKVVENNIVSYKDLLPNKQALEEFKGFLIREKLSKNIQKLNIESYIFDMQPYFSNIS